MASVMDIESYVVNNRNFNQQPCTPYIQKSKLFEHKIVTVIIFLPTSSDMCFWCSLRRLFWVPTTYALGEK